MINILSRFVAVVLMLLPAPLLAAGGVVSTADPRASEAGVEMLRKGGSAADAAMAAMLALTVVEPQSSGIGGGGFLLHHDGRTGLIESIDGRETAPAAAKERRFLAADGEPMSFRDAVPGGISVGVPGNVALMAKAHAKWGKLPWADLFAPAIRLAEEGFVVNQRLFDSLATRTQLWADFPAARALYFVDGQPAPVGTTIRNPALAAFLKRLAAEGPDAFYQGANVEAVSDTLADAPRNPAIVSREDFASYVAKERPPVCGSYRSYKVCGMGPPSSGAVAVIQILGMLERFDLEKLGRDSPVAWHLIGEAMRLGYADRDTWLADPDFVEVPVAGLIDPAYVHARSRLIDPRRPRADYPHGTPAGAPERARVESGNIPSTTHFVVVDGAGNIVSMTSTVEGAFGSQLIANGYVLNNELTDFSFAPAADGTLVANRVQPGKRPLSSMSPTIVYDAAGKPVFVVGAAGGRTIIMQVVKAIVARLDWGMDPRAAIATGLLYFNREGLVIEEGSDLVSMKPALEAMGHKVTLARLPLKANAAALTENGWQGAADPRSPGVALTE